MDKIGSPLRYAYDCIHSGTYFIVDEQAYNDALPQFKGYFKGKGFYDERGNKLSLDNIEDLIGMIREHLEFLKNANNL